MHARTHARMHGWAKHQPGSLDAINGCVLTGLSAISLLLPLLLLLAGWLAGWLAGTDNYNLSFYP